MLRLFLLNHDCKGIGKIAVKMGSRYIKTGENITTDDIVLPVKKLNILGTS